MPVEWLASRAVGSNGHEEDRCTGQGAAVVQASIVSLTDVAGLNSGDALALTVVLRPGLAFIDWQQLQAAAADQRKVAIGMRLDAPHYARGIGAHHGQAIGSKLTQQRFVVLTPLRSSSLVHGSSGSATVGRCRRQAAATHNSSSLHCNRS